MVITYELADNVFTAPSVECLEDEVGRFWAQMKISGLSVARVGEQVQVSFPDVEDIDAEEDGRIVVSYCNYGKFGKARKIIREWLEKTPWNSEAYRLSSQVEMMEGNIDDAIQKAKHSLKLNPRNLYALILLGNLLGRDKGEIDDAIKWYKRAIELYPESSLAVNNYAGCLLQTGKYDKAEIEGLFRKAVGLDKSNLQSYYGLASLALQDGDYRKAFEAAKSGLLNCKAKPENPMPVKEVVTEILVRAARELSKGIKFDVLKAKCDELAKMEGKKIEIVEDKDLPVLAKMELAERYGRDENRLVYSPRISDKGGTYLLMQELEKHHMHLEAKERGRNGAFVCDAAGAMKFKEDAMRQMTAKFRSLVPSSKMADAIESLRVGLGGHVMNTPLDFFSEIRTVARHEALAPDYAVASYLLCVEAIESVKAGKTAEVPGRILAANKVMNAAMFMLHRELSGLDMLDSLGLTSDEVKIAERIYRMCRDAAENPEPGDEWNVVRRLVDELGFNDFFRVEDAASRNAEEQRQKESNRNFQERIRSGGDVALNMAITMHMVDALSRLGGMDVNKVRMIAAQIAMLGTRGISPDKKSGYSVPALGNEDMSGPRILAYYYVSWKIGFPEKVGALGLPFEKEYETALSMKNGGM